MVTIKRIAIKDAYCANGNSPGGSKCHIAHDWCKQHGKRFGNGVTFALAVDVETVISELGKAGLEGSDDDYSWNVTELSDIIPENTIHLPGMFGTVPVTVISVNEGIVTVRSKRPGSRKKWLVKLATIDATLKEELAKIASC